jgi:protein SCO1/2
MTSAQRIDRRAGDPTGCPEGQGRAPRVPRRLIRQVGHALVAVGFLVASVRSAPAQTIQMADQPGTPANLGVPALAGVGIDQSKLNNQVPPDLAFVDETGKDVTIGQYFGQRPVVLALVYFNCPMLCSLVQNALSGTLAILKLKAGTDFDVLVVSINPGETPAEAADAKAKMVTLYRHPGTDGGLHFLTGREASIKRLADAVGFRYTYDPAIAQYAHPAAITVLTPDARVSRYLFGIDYGATDLRLALVDAAGGRIGTVIDQTLLYCYHYDPSTGRYSLAIMSLVRLGGLLTIVGIGLSIGFTLRRQRRQATAVAHTAAGVH